MKNVIVILGTLFFSLNGLRAIAQDKRPEVGNVCKVYIGQEGLRVSTCRIGPVENNEVLIGISGIDHPWNTNIFKAKVNRYDGKEDYETKIGGKPYVLMTYRRYYTIYLKQSGTTKPEQNIWYSEDASSGCKPEWLLTEYLEQEAKKK